MGILSGIEFDLDIVRESSYVNCHARGLNSIMLNSHQRIFQAGPPALTTQPSNDYMEIGFHNHRPEALKIEPIFGVIVDWRAKIADQPVEADMALERYEFSSAITGDGRPKVARRGLTFVAIDDIQALGRGTSTIVGRDEYHTVTVMTDAAWLLTEIGPSADTTTLLTPEYIEADDLYVKMDGDSAEHLLEWIIAMDGMEGPVTIE